MTLSLVPIGTKASVPRLPEPWNGRPRLNDRCSRVRPGEAMLVVAFPGAGKTTLLTDWITNNCDAANRAWLTLDARDNAPGRLGTLLAHALGVDAASDDLSGRHCSDTVVIDRIFEALDARAERTVLVLDDVHEITSRPALAALSHLVLSLPPTLSVFLATRADPPLPLQRLQFDGRLHQLRTSDLALTQHEAEELFRSHAVTLASDDIESLRTRTGGWAGGMRLAALALGENADPELFVENVVRTEALISDYLVREVLDSQTPEMRRFLLQTCVAQVLTKDLARALGRPRFRRAARAARTERRVRDAGARLDENLSGSCALRGVVARSAPPRRTRGCPLVAHPRHALVRRARHAGRGRAARLRSGRSAARRFALVPAFRAGGALRHLGARRGSRLIGRDGHRPGARAHRRRQRDRGAGPPQRGHVAETTGRLVRGGRNIRGSRRRCVVRCGPAAARRLLRPRAGHRCSLTFGMPGSDEH